MDIKDLKPDEKREILKALHRGEIAKSDLRQSNILVISKKSDCWPALSIASDTGCNVIAIGEALPEWQKLLELTNNTAKN